MPADAPVATVTDVVARLRADVATLVALDLAGVDPAERPELHRALATVAGQVQAVAARVLARVADDGAWAGAGWRTFEQWASRTQGASVGAARRDTALGRALDTDLPATRAGVETGTLTLEHAQVLARYAPTTPARQAALASDHPDLNEAHLVETATRQNPDEFARTVRRWAATVDATAAQAEHDAAAAREHLTLTRRPDGVALIGFLTHEHGETLALALRAVAGVPAATDTRSHDQRQAAALVDAALLVLDRGLAGTGQSVRPHLSVLVSWETLTGQIARAADHDRTTHPDDDAATSWLPADWAGATTPPAETTGGTLLPQTVLDRLACDSEITRIVFGPTGDVLDLGRAQRTYTGQQRRAVIARDKSCRYPGCGAPVSLGEIHHVIPWHRHGRTSISNGILLCWHHHDLIHRQGIHITRDQRRGRWVFTRNDGTPIGDEPPVNRATAISGAPAANGEASVGGAPAVSGTTAAGATAATSDRTTVDRPTPLREHTRASGVPPRGQMGEPQGPGRTHPHDAAAQGTLPLSA